jgi:hypothetical protein
MPAHSPLDSFLVQILFRGQRDAYEQIVRDLQAEGLIGQGQFLPITMTGGSMVQSRTTDRGKRFIMYLSKR